MQLNRVSYKLFFGMLLLSSFILVIMTILVKNSYTASLKKNEINFHVRATDRTKYQFDFVIDVIDNAARSISSNTQIIDTLWENNPPFHNRVDFSVNTYLQSLQTIQPFLGDIIIAGIDGEFYTSNLAITHGDIETMFEKYKILFLDGVEKDYFVETQNDLYASNTYKNVLTGVWPIYNTKTQEFWGEIFLGLNYTIFQEMFILSPITNDEKFMMIDSDNNIVFSYPAYENFDEVLLSYPQILYNKEITIEGIVAGSNSIIVSEHSDTLGWKFIRIIDAENVTQDTQKMQHYFNIVFAMSIIISIVFSIYVSHILTRPIKKLFTACKNIENGDMSARVHIRTNDEMGQLGKTFNLIMDQINDNFEREMVEQKRKNELKLEILQSQINPHFLYNTLDSIKFLANLQEVHNIASMSDSLITLLKYNLSHDSLTSLGDEIETIKKYFAIQKYRFGDIFEFKLDIDRNTEKCRLSRFVLQPIVENSLVHGFEDTESGGEILIRSFIEGNKLTLQVIDNGGGMDEATLARVNCGIESGKRYNDIGVSNVRERIILQFGDSASLRYSCGKDGGTTATLIFPVMEKFKS